MRDTPSPLSSLWLETDLGHIGRTMSHGAARILADLVTGRRLAINMTSLTLVERATRRCFADDAEVSDPQDLAPR